MKIQIEGEPKEIAELLQAIESSKEQTTSISELAQKLSTHQLRL